MRPVLISFVFFLVASVAVAKIKVITTLPEIAEAAQAVGGDQVEAQSLLRGHEDPHYAEARPDYILKVNRADLVCAMGLELEIGWLPKVLAKSGKAQVQEGGAGYCVLGKSVAPLNVPRGVVDRSLGDVHAHGNPHFNLSPVKLADGAAEILHALTRLAPEKKDLFEKNYAQFKARMTRLQEQGQARVRKIKVMEYHQEFTYFFAAYNLESLGSLEEKAGSPPSAARIAAVAKAAKENKVAVLFATPSAPHKVLERFTELSGVPVRLVPSYVNVGKNSDAKNIEELQNLLLKSLP